MSDTNKIFDDFPKVKCHDCESYYLNQCDGVLNGSERLCKAFVAVRGESIPLKLERLERAFKWILGLCVVLSIISVSTLVLVLKMMFGG